MKRILTLSIALCFGLFAKEATAHDYTAGDLNIIHPVVFATPKAAKAGAGYMVIANDGDTDDKLVEVRADFPRVMIHNTETSADGVARMIHMDALDIPAGETVELAPGGFHVMLMGLTEPLESGTNIPATLVFESAGEVDVIFMVVERPKDGNHDHSNH